MGISFGMRVRSNDSGLGTMDAYRKRDPRISFTSIFPVSLFSSTSLFEGATILYGFVGLIAVANRPRQVVVFSEVSS